MSFSRHPVYKSRISSRSCAGRHVRGANEEAGDRRRGLKARAKWAGGTKERGPSSGTRGRLPRARFEECNGLALRSDHPVDNRPPSSSSFPPSPLLARGPKTLPRLYLRAVESNLVLPRRLCIVLLRQFISNSRFDPRVHPVVQRVPSAGSRAAAAATPFVGFPTVTRKGQWAIDVRVMGYQLTGCNLRAADSTAGRVYLVDFFFSSARVVVVARWKCGKEFIYLNFESLDTIFFVFSFRGVTEKCYFPALPAMCV